MTITPNIVADPGKDASESLPQDENLEASVSDSWREAMMRGDFEAAWVRTDRIEMRRRKSECYDPSRHLLWDGTSLNNRRVLIRCNHGLGDTVQFARFVPNVVKIAREVHFLVQPPLVDLFNRMKGFGNVMSGWADDLEPEHDVAIEVMELAYALRITRAQLCGAPYFDVEVLPPNPVEGGSGTGTPRIGIVWASSSWDSTRSVPPEALSALSRVSGRFIGLQQDQPPSAWARLPFLVEPVAHLTRDVTAAASAMADLDLLVTVDTLAAHLAGALGIPTVLLLQHQADWRWMRGVHSTSWYSNTRLFRQAHPGDWQSAVESAAAWIRRGMWRNCTRSRRSNDAFAGGVALR